jgi:hypothetical protein
LSRTRAWKVLAGLSAVLLLMPLAATAQGCGPTRLKVSESLDVGAPPAALWKIVGDFQDLGWDGVVAKVAGVGGNQPDQAVRTVVLTSGATFSESLYKYDAEAMSYSYHVDKIDVERLPVQNMSASLDVVATDGGAHSRLVWRAAFYRYLKPNEPAPDIADADASKAVSAYLRAGLDGLKAKLAAKS